MPQPTVLQRGSHDRLASSRAATYVFADFSDELSKGAHQESCSGIGHACILGEAACGDGELMVRELRGLTGAQYSQSTCLWPEVRRWRVP